MATATPDDQHQPAEPTVVQEPASQHSGGAESPPPASDQGAQTSASDQGAQTSASDQGAQRSGYLRWLVLGLIAGLVGIGIGFAIGAATKKTAKAQTVTRPAQTITHTVASSSVTNNTKTVTVARTVTAPTKTVTRTVHAAAPAPSGASRATVGGETFTGNSAQSLGTIKVPSDSTLYWQCASCASTAIMITSDVNSDGNAINVMSRLTSGQSSIAADIYKNVRVNAQGPFTITIR